MAIEIAEAMKSVNLLELSEKTQHAPAALDENETVVAAELDRAFRKIGETGSDPDHLIATLITRTITEDVINADDSYLDLMFDRGNVGEFDKIEAATPTNRRERREFKRYMQRMTSTAKPTAERATSPSPAMEAPTAADHTPETPTPRRRLRAGHGGYLII